MLVYEEALRASVALLRLCREIRLEGKLKQWLPHTYCLRFLSLIPEGGSSADVAELGVSAVERGSAMWLKVRVVS